MEKERLKSQSSFEKWGEDPFGLGESGIGQANSGNLPVQMPESSVNSSSQQLTYPLSPTVGQSHGYFYENPNWASSPSSQIVPTHHQFGSHQSNLYPSLNQTISGVVTRDVTYVSDPEDVPPNKSSRDTPKSKKDEPAIKKISSDKPTKPAKSSSLPSAIQSTTDLSHLGKWKLLSKQDKLHSIIIKYALNSAEVNPKQVKVYGIYELDTGYNFPSYKSEHKMLLWFKTSQGSIQHLRNGSDSVVAFYDRLARALLVNPKNVTEPTRQVVLLCRVTLGNGGKKSFEGYQKWSKTKNLDGHESVKAKGSLSPNWKGNATIDSSTIVPCGETVRLNDVNYGLEYSEYMVYEANRVKVKYAVDVEIRPAKS